MVQAEIENIYRLFKKRVAEGRQKDTAYVDSIAQGRIWTGARAKDIGLIDRFGGIDDAIRSAAAKAKLTKYYVKEYPEAETILEQLFGKSSSPVNFTEVMKKELGKEQFMIYQQMKKVQEMTNVIQARLPFDFIIGYGGRENRPN